jgi:ribosomal peptide maturation radical SAM protein 1
VTDTKTLLIVMPWAGVQHGALGVSTLAAILQRAGIASDVLYLNVDFARRVRTDFYHFISARGGSRFNGEVFFTPEAFGLDVQQFIYRELLPYYADVFATVDQTVGSPVRERNVAEFQAYCAEVCGRIVPAFLDDIVARVPWSDYDVAGFSLMFDQTLASLALAQRIRARHPEIKIAFGGASCEAEMGVEMARAFDGIDVVSLGESDATIVPIVNALRGRGALEAIPGVAFRRGNDVVQTGAPPPLQDLDALPFPDYRDYIAQTEGLAGWQRSLYFETSRGCWWGQKHLCSFCGLNANGLAFRKKSAARAVHEIIAQAERYGVRDLRAADNILDVDYFRSVLPQLAAWNAARDEEQRLAIFYEIKSNVRKEHLRIMREAGIGEVQPGIESFSDGILKRMDKGSTGIQQMQFLKWATELGIDVTYGIIHSNPGDTPADYDEMAEAVPFIEHLLPPSYIVPMVLERFSPYFNEPSRHGIENVRPGPSYAVAFPGLNIERARLAYMFSYDHAMQHDQALQASMQRCLEAMRRWRTRFVPDRLVYDEHDGAVCVVDRRGAKPAATWLRGLQAEIFLACDEIHSFAHLSDAFHVDGERLRDFLDLLVARRWMFRDRRDRYLALPIRRPGEAHVSAAIAQRAAAATHVAREGR